jgi:hypothetical protein
MIIRRWYPNSVAVCVLLTLCPNLYQVEDSRCKSSWSPSVIESECSHWPVLVNFIKVDVHKPPVPPVAVCDFGDHLCLWSGRTVVIWGGLIHVDMSAHNKMALPTEIGTDRSETVVNHKRDPHQQPRLLQSRIN